MNKLKRRDLLYAPAFPMAALAQSAAEQTTDPTPGVKALMVARREDRLGQKRTIGVSSTFFKVVKQDTNGALFVMENVIAKRGGPPRHLHYNEDEYFYVVEGEFVVELAGKRFPLKAGDSILGPRKVPHAYAFIGTGQGRLLISYAPANKMQEYFSTRREGAKYSSDAERFRTYGMELVGPPIEL